MKENSQLARTTSIVEGCENMTDEEVMVNVRTAPDSFAVLIERYENKLRRYMVRVMPGLREEVDDVLQEVFIKAYIHVHDFDTQQKFSSWVYRIAHNEAVSWLRKKKARPELVELGEDDFQTFLQSMDDAFSVHEVVLAKDEVARVLGAMESRYREILVLRFLEGRSYEDMSDILSVPIGTIATKVHRAKKQFSNLYAKQYE